MRKRSRTKQSLALSLLLPEQHSPGVMLLEEMVKPKEPQLAGHDNVYATDNGATLFKYETLAEQGNDAVTTAEIIGYIIFILLVLLLVIPWVCAIIKIKKMCGKDVSAFSLGRSPKESDKGQQKA